VSPRIILIELSKKSIMCQNKPVEKLNYTKLNLPDNPGVYLFKEGSKVLYIGRATSLRDRVRSYFANDLIATRGPLLVDMVTKANKVDFQHTDSVLEAIILEAKLIKQYQPWYNTKEKDNRSFNFIVITNEDFPRVLLVRERELETGVDYKIKIKFGPFTQGTALKEGLKILRKIFPYRSECKLNQKSPCFNFQIGLCPGTCVGMVSKVEYNKTIKNLVKFFSGEKDKLVRDLEKEMNALAKTQEFEKASKIKKTIFALKHIQDVGLIKDSNEGEKASNKGKIGLKTGFRMEAYDVAHLSGEANVGVMVVFENGELTPAEYRKFIIKQSRQDDLRALQEIVSRRLEHTAWTMPDLLVADGDKRQLVVIKKALAEKKVKAEVVAVTKNDKHKAVVIVGNPEIIAKYKSQILKLNAEAHRFAIKYHREKMRKNLIIK